VRLFFLTFRPVTAFFAMSADLTAFFFRTPESTEFRPGSATAPPHRASRKRHEGDRHRGRRCSS
jgi:hypothetical protein